MDSRNPFSPSTDSPMFNLFYILNRTGDLDDEVTLNYWEALSWIQGDYRPIPAAILAQVLYVNPKDWGRIYCGPLGITFRLIIPRGEGDIRGYNTDNTIFILGRPTYSGERSILRALEYALEKKADRLLEDICD